MDNFEWVLKGHTDMAPFIEINFSNLHLVQPCRQYMESFQAAILEYMAFRVEDFAYPKLDRRRDVRAYFKNLENFRKGKVAAHLVPSSAFWLVDGKNYLGSGDVRHRLNDKLRRLGGNIGYSIRPAAWRQGLGSLQLSLLLKEAKKLEIKKPIITCYDDNVASAKVIEKNGGVLIEFVKNDYKGSPRLTRIYEVENEN